MRPRCLLCLAAIIALSFVFDDAFAADLVSWPQWRGPEQDGVAPGANYPLRWNDEAGIDWKTKLPGLGGSTPVVADSTAYLTAGVDGKNSLIAIDTATGDIKWTAAMGDDTGGKHRKGSGSNPSPVIDGDSVFAYFRSGALGCVDSGGKIRWQINLQEKYGEDTLWWDLGSSPLLTDRAVVVAVMQTGPSYVVALNKQTGDVLWKQDRVLDAPEEAAQSYSTPLAITEGDQELIAVMGADHLTLHDAKTGTELTRLGGFNPTGHEYFRSISSPVADAGIIVCPYARGETLTAVRISDLLAGQGSDAIAWFRDDLGSDVPTPAAHGGKLYVVGDGKQTKGTISCLDIQTGKTLWNVELPKSRLSFSSSPLVAGNHLYVPAENGTTHVIGPIDSADPQVVASNELADDEPYTVASPVPAGDGSLLLRTRNFLYRIAGR